jgi:hypothetical protein
MTHPTATLGPGAEFPGLYYLSMEEIGDPTPSVLFNLHPRASADLIFFTILARAFMKQMIDMME